MNRKSIALKRAAVKERIVVGIDIGKFWHVARVLLPNGEFLKPFRFYNDGHGFYSTHGADLTAQPRARKGCSGRP